MSLQPYLDHPVVPTALFLAAISCFVLFSIRLRKGLRDLPGPFFASIFPFDRMLTTYSGHQFAKHLAYHEKYGPVVRVGPKHVSISDSDQISVIYNITSKFNKVTATPRFPFAQPY